MTFIAITPCRVMDTRAGEGFTGAFGPPSLPAFGTARQVPMPSSSCNIPSNAGAYSLNITAVSPAGQVLSFLSVWPAGQPYPGVSTLNDSLAGATVANAAIVVAGGGGAIQMVAGNPTDVIIDINGYYAAPTDGNGNTASGAGTLANNTTGAENTASGYQALQNNTTGSANTATGYQALATNTTGFANTASGYFALASNTTGTYNTAVGDYALIYNTTGGNNTASGAVALESNTSGSNNTASGFEALVHNTTGSNNIAIGYQAGVNVSNFNSNNIHIGNQGAPTDGAVIRIGTPGTQSYFFVAGVRGFTTGNGDAVPVMIDSSGQLGTMSLRGASKKIFRTWETPAVACCACGPSPSATSSPTPTDRSPSITG